MSPLGIYPDRSVALTDAAFIVAPDLCFSIVRIVKEEWGFSEVDSLAPLGIPLFGSMILSGAGYPYPVSGVTLESSFEPLNEECIGECRQHLLNAIEEQKSHEWPSAFVHRPPVLGGRPYELYDYGFRD
jgi:hypothetical protein